MFMNTNCSVVKCTRRIFNNDLHIFENEVPYGKMLLYIFSIYFFVCIDSLPFGLYHQFGNNLYILLSSLVLLEIVQFRVFRDFCPRYRGIWPRYSGAWGNSLFKQLRARGRSSVSFAAQERFFRISVDIGLDVRI